MQRDNDEKKSGILNLPVYEFRNPKTGTITTIAKANALFDFVDNGFREGREREVGEILDRMRVKMYSADEWQSLNYMQHSGWIVSIAADTNQKKNQQEIDTIRKSSEATINEVKDEMELNGMDFKQLNDSEGTHYYGTKFSPESVSIMCKTELSSQQLDVLLQSLVQKNLLDKQTMMAISNSDDPRVKISKFKQALNDYIGERSLKREETGKQRTHTFLGKPLPFGSDADDKINGAKKLLAHLNGNTKEIFTQKEVQALRTGDLNKKIINKYEDLLPRSFLEIESELKESKGSFFPTSKKW